ncbi:snoRNA-binding protein [Orbilia ellipsospora]|uniref:H/ACA ribonucleoprotein complex subunit 2 n=1 Tax=Orbilia ellipsospora TaxID=2528407 RepID=A0AAV9WZ82_9PEZI
MAKDTAAKDASKKRKRDGSKSPSPLADPESSKVTKPSKSDKKEKKDKSDKKDKKDKEKSEKKDKKEKKEKSKKKKDEDGDNADTSMVDVDETAVEEVKMEIDTEGAPLVPPGALVAFAKPLAEGKLAKKVLKTTKKAAKTKALKRGVKEVVKALRKSPNHAAAAASSKPDTKSLPLLILAADISPPDVISHLPVLAEDHGIPYIFVTSRAELGAAGATKRPTSVVMITPESAGKRKAGKKDKKDKDGEDGKDKGLDKIKEEEEEFRSSYKELVKEVLGVTKAMNI